MSPLLPQSGIGIELREGNLYAFCGKRLWNRVRVVDRLAIPQYRQLPPAECGRQFRQFLRKDGLKAPWTVVALPRSLVLLRGLRFPRGVENDLARAVEYQLDSLHPFEEGSVFWDFARGDSAEKAQRATQPGEGSEVGSDPMDVLVAIAQKQSVEELASWFQEAGIPVSQFGVTTTLLLTMLRSPFSRQSPASSTFFLLDAREEGIEVMGCAPGKTVVSREVPLASGAPSEEGELLAAVARELELARSELRLGPEERPALLVCGKTLLRESALESASLPFTVLPIEQVLSPLSGRAEELSLRENLVGIAAALAAVDRKHPLALNLLPPERRSYQSPLAYLPSYALSSLVALVAVGLGVRGTIQDGLYSRYLEQETEALRPRVQQLETLQDQNQRVYNRLAILAGLRHSAGFPLEILEELTGLLPEDAWVQQLQYEGNSITLTGLAQSASAVLQALSTSTHLESPQFLSAITRTQDGKEVFRIGARLRVPNR